jgi:ribosomal protein S3
VKVWIFKGEVFDKAEIAELNAEADAAQAAQGAAANAAAAASTTPAA